MIIFNKNKGLQGYGRGFDSRRLHQISFIFSGLPFGSRTEPVTKEALEIVEGGG